MAHHNLPFASAVEVEPSLEEALMTQRYALQEKAQANVDFTALKLSA
jgi:hypothetical protein